MFWMKWTITEVDHKSVDRCIAITNKIEHMGVGITLQFYHILVFVIRKLSEPYIFEEIIGVRQTHFIESLVSFI